MTDERDPDAAPDAERPADAGSPGIASPCTSVCRMDQDGLYCVGCFRTLDEIAGWSAFDEARRRQIWGELNRRKLAISAQGVCDSRH